MVENLINLWQEQAFLYNINRFHYTGKAKRKVTVEKIQDGFDESGLINQPSTDMILEKINSLRSSKQKAEDEMERALEQRTNTKKLSNEVFSDLVCNASRHLPAQVLQWKH